MILDVSRGEEIESIRFADVGYCVRPVNGPCIGAIFGNINILWEKSVKISFIA